MASMLQLWLMVGRQLCMLLKYLKVRFDRGLFIPLSLKMSKHKALFLQRAFYDRKINDYYRISVRMLYITGISECFYNERFMTGR